MTKSEKPINHTSTGSEGGEDLNVIHISHSVPWLSASVLANKGEIRHTVRFSEAERMIFARWKNRYQTTRNYLNLFSNLWCPLFGVIPFTDFSDHPFLKTAIDLIKHARRFWGIPLHISVLCPEAYPDPGKISRLTGYPKEKLMVARKLFESEDHQKGLLQQASASELRTLLVIENLWKVLRQFYESDSFAGKDKFLESSLRYASKSLMSAYEDCLNEKSLMGHEAASAAVQHKEWRNGRVKEMYEDMADRFNHRPYSIAREIAEIMKIKNGIFQRSFEKQFGKKHEKNADGLYYIQIPSQKQIRRIIANIRK